MPLGLEEAASSVVPVSRRSPVRFGELLEALEVTRAETVLPAEVSEPLDHGVAADQPGPDPIAVFAGPMPDAGRQRRERMTDRRMDLARVAGQELLDLPASVLTVTTSSQWPGA